MVSAYTLTGIMAAIAATVWGWNAAAIAQQVLDQSAHAPSESIPCGSDCRMVSGHGSQAGVLISREQLPPSAPTAPMARALSLS